MNEYDHELMEEIKMKVKQQEETITQLLEIVAATNKRLSHFVESYDTPV